MLIFFDLIKGPLRRLPLFIAFFVQFHVSMKRIQKFIDSDELDLEVLIDRSGESLEEDTAVRVNKASFSWGIKKSEDKKKVGKGKKKDKSGKNKKEKKITVDNHDEKEESLLEETKQQILPRVEGHEHNDGGDDDPEIVAEEKEESQHKDEKKHDMQSLESIITLKEIDLTIHKGEFVCIIGDVGSGKSSLLQALIGSMLYTSPELIG